VDVSSVIAAVVGGWLAVTGAAVVVVSAVLLLHRRRWSRLRLLAAWVLAGGLTWCASVLIALLIPVTLFGLFELLTLLPSSPGSYLQWEFQPEGGWAIATAVLGWPWILAVALSALSCGLRGSARARLWLLATALTAPFVAVFPLGLCWVGEVAPYGAAVAAVFGVCEVALIGLIGLMRGQPPE
jgi:hypothetical protein